MPFAIDGRIAQDPIEGGIEITAEQYADALDGMLEGKLIVIRDGVLMAEFPVTPEPEPDPTPTAEEILRNNIAAAPRNLFGGPTLGEIFHGR